MSRIKVSKGSLGSMADLTLTDLLLSKLPGSLDSVAALTLPKTLILGLLTMKSLLSIF